MKEKDPATILNRLNELTKSTLKQSHTLDQDGFDIGICAIHKEKKELHYAGAMIKLYYGTDACNIQELPVARRGIGGAKFQYEASFETHVLPLLPNTTYYMTSDGFQDQFGGPKNSKFYSKRLKALLGEVCNLSMSKQEERLNDALSKWMAEGQEPQTDDVLVIGFRPVVE